MALELALGYDLFDIIAKTGKFEDELCRYYFKQLLGALDFCHSKKMCHRDLKPSNLLLSQDFQLKLADFGFSSCLEGHGDKSKLSKLLTIVGTGEYMAPELNEEEAYNGQAVDLFAAAVILFVMRAAQPPWRAAYIEDKFYRAFVDRNKQFWHINRHNNFDKEFKNLLNRMFMEDPDDRLSMKEVLAHPYL